MLPRTAWISSRITVDTPLKIRRLVLELSSRLRLSGVVIRISGGRRSICWRSFGGVSPLRVSTRIGGNAAPACFKTRPQFLEGLQQVALHVVVERFRGETYRTRTRPPGQSPVIGFCSVQRKAARVLPLPVGAVIRTCSPRATRAARPEPEYRWAVPLFR